MAWQIYLKAKNNVQQQISLPFFLSSPPPPQYLCRETQRTSLENCSWNQCGILETGWLTYFWIIAHRWTLTKRRCENLHPLEVMISASLQGRGEQVWGEADAPLQSPKNKDLQPHDLIGRLQSTHKTKRHLSANCCFETPWPWNPPASNISFVFLCV